MKYSQQFANWKRSPPIFKMGVGCLLQIPQMFSYWMSPPYLTSQLMAFTKTLVHSCTMFPRIFIVAYKVNFDINLTIMLLISIWVVGRSRLAIYCPLSQGTSDHCNRECHKWSDIFGYVLYEFIFYTLGIHIFIFLVRFFYIFLYLYQSLHQGISDHS